ncbi:uncharacterized protein K444DRAFT_626838 [Hyaloscypha bicolor E]|jgi:hypothetical protein|uniref:Uncharacterized protein n=1 Tax=Hyaloscypha bicolor E TaxID=1095630 RepID=A0A2J6TJ93_9HELO|nr:uncharacterized protein K444DRAFT_626838 [Hyaloscypha bicolor E]PMD63089.1 hypothetical protein K444DRAFT_626838 [Hyaloscypha bicolor E]
MFFKKLRSRSKANSKHSISRITSTSSSHGNSNRQSHSKVPEVMVTPPTNDLTERLAMHENMREGGQRSEDEERDYQLFLEQARKEEEKAERRRLAEIKAARQVNLSPWSGRM